MLTVAACTQPTEAVDKITTKHARAMAIRLLTSSSCVLRARCKAACRQAPSSHTKSSKRTFLRVNCTSGRQQPHDGKNGGGQQEDDPVAAMLWAAQQDGMQVVFEGDADAEDDLDDILDDLEDPWMRNPSRE